MKFLEKLFNNNKTHEKLVLQPQSKYDPEAERIATLKKKIKEFNDKVTKMEKTKS